MYRAWAAAAVLRHCPSPVIAPHRKGMTGSLLLEADEGKQRWHSTAIGLVRDTVSASFIRRSEGKRCTTETQPPDPDTARMGHRNSCMYPELLESL